VSEKLGKAGEKLKKAGAGIQGMMGGTEFIVGGRKYMAYKKLAEGRLFCDTKAVSVLFCWPRMKLVVTTQSSA
jgi:hypothetical protein